MKTKRDYILLAFTTSKRVHGPTERDRFKFAKARELMRRGYAIEQARPLVEAAWKNLLAARKATTKSLNARPSKPQPTPDEVRRKIRRARNFAHQESAALFQTRQHNEADGHLDQFLL